MINVKKTWLFFLSLAMMLSLMAGTAFAEESGTTKSRRLTAAVAEEDATPIVAASAKEDGDELLMAFIEEQVSIQSEAKYSTYGRSHLSGMERKLYDLLLEQIRLIARGKLTNTKVQIPMKELGMIKSYTASDLGLSTLTSGGKISEKAKEALKNTVYTINYKRVFNAMLFDCPCDLYWYDKVNGTSFGFSAGITADYDKSIEEYRIAFDPDSSLEFSFFVSAEYAVNNLLTSTNVDSKTIGTVNAAIANAKDIVEANKDKTDYQKLKAYKDEICALVSYNHTAMLDNNRPYGNPWQLIWVFDKDPSTNVVCEGYSKAFQFLCDSGSFTNENVSSYIVSGKMKGGTGEGGHMWNLVTMNDGKNYVVDVTNCDSGTAGYPDKLFLAGGTGSGEVDYTIAAVSYAYDKETKENYAASELAISPSAYREGTEDIIHLKDFTIRLSANKVTYNGRDQKPKVTVYAGSKALAVNKDYTVTWPKDMKSVGTKTIVVKLTGNYTGSAKASYVINPKGTALSKVSAVSKGFTAKWKAAKTETTGYQIQYSTSLAFKNAKKVMVKDNAVTAAKVLNLKAKKTCYVRIRTYKKVGSKTYYSDWSKAKKVTTKQ